MQIVRVGWNDAAWGRPHRHVESALEYLYQRGYAGGMVFRDKQQTELLGACTCLEALVATRTSRLNRTIGLTATKRFSCGPCDHVAVAAGHAVPPRPVV